MVNLFEPVKLGAVQLKNRIVMAPLTRTRACPGRIPNELMRQYYCQRADAGLIISEGTAISPQGVGYPNAPGVWCKAQVEGWKKITAAVHAKGGKMFLQLWHVGRVSDPEYLNGGMPVAPSAIVCEGHVNLLRPQREYVVPRALHTEEIPAIVADFAQAARNAQSAGFDGVEIDSANGYLLDQFLHDGSNKRCDKYGGSVENRARLLLEVVDSCIGIWCADRVGVHLSPRGGSHAMFDSNPEQIFNYVAEQLGRRKIAFIFSRESSTEGSHHLAAIKRLFGGPIIANEGYDLASAQRLLSFGDASAVAFGKAFIANPDLVARLRTGAALNQPDPGTFFGDGAKGYTDYPVMAACDHEVAAQ